MSIGPLRGASAANLRALFEDAARRTGIAGPGQSNPAGQLGPSGPAAPAGPSFTDSLVRAIGQANQLQLEADEMSRALAAGQAAELHSVMLAAEKANLALQFTLQVRNKVIEAYQEVMRVQV